MKVAEQGGKSSGVGPKTGRHIVEWKKGAHKKEIRIYAPFPWMPPYWVRVTPRSGMRSAAQKRDWRLVLSARAIPYLACRIHGADHLYVPCLLSGLATHELAAYIWENYDGFEDATCDPDPFNTWPLGPLLVLPLIWWHGCQLGWWAPPELLAPATAWQAAGKLDAINVLFDHQWWRFLTALTLHSGVAHLSGNIFFGAIFLGLLARLCGFGLAWLIAVLGGGLGNCASILVHNLNYSSLGFSTALFAVIGALGSLMSVQMRKKALLPLGAAGALLAMLGTEGAQTDYGAHVCGLFCGIILGWGAALLRGRMKSKGVQAIAASCAILMLAGAWVSAFMAR